MKPEPLPPIPSPPEHYWRQFRVNVLPVLGFTGILVVTVWLWDKNLANPVVMGQAESTVTDVSNPVPRRLAQLKVSHYQQVAELIQTVEVAGKACRELDPATADTESPAIKAALAVSEQNLRLAEAQLRPLVLVTPIDGRISQIDHFTGSTVVEGAPIVTVASMTPDRIVGYLARSLRIEPEVGMKAEVRRRGLVWKVSQAEVVDIGPRIEMFDAPLRIRGMGGVQERGLPILISIPPNLNVRAGELVDIRLLVN